MAVQYFVTLFLLLKFDTKSNLFYATLKFCDVIDKRQRWQVDIVHSFEPAWLYKCLGYHNANKKLADLVVSAERVHKLA